jgi:hypothetical protein
MVEPRDAATVLLVRDAAATPGICECSSNCRSRKAGNCKRSKQTANSGHSNIKFTGDIQRKEREKKRSTDAVNKGDNHENPKYTRILIIYIFHFLESILEHFSSILIICSIS